MYESLVKYEKSRDQGVDVAVPRLTTFALNLYNLPRLASAMVLFSRRILALFACAAGAAQALHFYLDATDHRCFIEELPTDTVVEGTYRAVTLT
jgi:hypothetical protein